MHTTIQVFRKYSHSLGPEALQFLEEVLDRHKIEDADVEFSIETIAKEYNKQDDAAMKVSLDILQRVYDALQDQASGDAAETELLDPDSHLYTIDAFEMPLWNWSHERGTFERSASLVLHWFTYFFKDEPGEGLYTEGCIALVEGEYTQDETLEVIAIGQPPCEDRDTARSIYGHIDFLGKGSTTLLEDSQYARRVREELSDVYFFFLSDVWLDVPQTFVGLQKMFDNCMENNFIPKAIVMCGNFTSRSITQGSGRDIQRYQVSMKKTSILLQI
ncbi:hypothetical protein ID866_2241 [Astraeus odoratus]|nr:hypothetical protein ID866_2241 [Astraeus odoratus]